MKPGWPGPGEALERMPMRPRALQDCGLWRPPGGRLLCCLLVLAAGCQPPQRSAEHVAVTGQVLLDGKPVTGGQVTFITVNGGFVSTGRIDEQGNYKIEAPVG